jgi:mannose-1-phosphate guanylyltransferase
VDVAMVLTAGRGERIRPLSDVVPKPALPLPQGSVVGWPLGLAARLGVRRIVANSWHLAERMERVLEADCPSGVELLCSREDELMGTAGGLALARDRGLLDGQGPVLVANGDCVLALDLGPLLEQHRRTDDLVTLALLPHLEPTRWSRVELDGAGRVVRITPPGTPDAGEEPFLYPGVMVVARSALDDLPVTPCDIGDRLWTPAQAEGRLGGVVVTGHWREVGTPSDYLGIATAQAGDGSASDPSASVSRSARLRGSFLGQGARIEPGAVVTGSVVAHGAVIGSGARVTRSIVLGPTAVAPNQVLADAIRVAPLDG